MQPYNYIKFALIIFIFLSSKNQLFSQEWSTEDFGYSGHNTEFLNANTGFIGVTINDNGYKYKILKTTNKGANFISIWSTPTSQYNQQAFAFDMINENEVMFILKGHCFAQQMGVVIGFKDSKYNMKNLHFQL